MRYKISEFAELEVHQRIQNVRENHENQVVSAIVQENPQFVTLDLRDAVEVAVVGA